MQCITSNLSLFLVFTLYFVSLVLKEGERLLFSDSRIMYKMIDEMTNFFIGV